MNGSLVQFNDPILFGISGSVLINVVTLSVSTFMPFTIVPEKAGSEIYRQIWCCMKIVSHKVPLFTYLIGDVSNFKRPLLIIPKVQLRLRVTRRSATALARYPQKCNCACALPAKVGKNCLRVKIL